MANSVEIWLLRIFRSARSARAPGWKFSKIGQFSKLRKVGALMNVPLMSALQVFFHMCIYIYMYSHNEKMYRHFFSGIHTHIYMYILKRSTCFARMLFKYTNKKCVLGLWILVCSHFFCEFEELRILLNTLTNPLEFGLVQSISLSLSHTHLFRLLLFLHAHIRMRT